VPDEVRFLHRRGTPAYTHLRSQAMPAEPEAVSKDAQDLLSWQARQRQRTTWETARDRILADIEHVRAHVRSPHVRRATRALQREVARPTSVDPYEAAMPRCGSTGQSRGR
jgi:hypothetical protein